jgi:hypothetical protein
MQITLTGTGFGSTIGRGGVYVGGISAPIVSWSDTQIIFTVPQGIAVSGGVQVFQSNAYSTRVNYYTVRQ